jgi:hypothetical protein
MTDAKGLGGRKYFWLAAVVIAALLFVPFPTQLSPEFTIRFVDDLGNPISGMEVQRTCTHYTYDSIGWVCPEDWDNPKRTDENGNVSFTRNHVWYGAASRVVRTVLSYMMLIAHGSVGRSITLFPRTPAGIKSSAWVDIDPDDPQKEVVLKRESVPEQR